MESLCLTSKILLSDHNVKIHQYEYGRCFRMKIREDCVNLSDVMFGLTVYVHSELNTPRQMCARDKLNSRIWQE